MMLKLMFSLLINSFKQEDPIDSAKSIALSVLVVAQSGLTWLLKKVNKMIGALMSTTTLAAV